MKRGFDFDDVDDRHKQIKSASEYAFKFLGHHTFVGAILGKGGVMVNQIHNETGVEVAVARKTEFYANTKFRVVHVTADARDKLTQGVFRIVDLMPELADSATDAVRKDCIGDNPGDFRINFLIPKNLCPRIIGTKNGDVIKDIRARTGCVFNVSHEPEFVGPVAENICEIVGPVDKIQDILTQVMDALEEEKQQQWYSRWASSKSDGAGGRTDGNQHAPHQNRRDVRDGRDRGRDFGGRTTRERSVHRQPQPSRSAHNSNAQTNTRGRWKDRDAHVDNLRAETDAIASVDHDMDVEASTRVPVNLAGCLLGPRGAEVKKMEDSSGARILLNEPHPREPEREVTIKGTPSQVCTALLMIWGRLREKSLEQSGY